MQTKYDGDWLIRELNKKKATRPLAKRLERMRALFSVRLDLDYAMASLKSLMQNQASLSETVVISDEQGVLDRGAATFAIIAYARATDTSSNLRGAFDPRRFYTKNQKSWHKNVIALRNEAVAHFGPGAHPSGSWATDNLIFTVSRNPLLLGFASQHHRANYNGRVVLELMRLIEIALKGLENDRADLQKSIINELELTAGPFVQLLVQCPEPLERRFQRSQYLEPLTHVLEPEDFEGTELEWIKSVFSN